MHFFEEEVNKKTEILINSFLKNTKENFDYKKNIDSYDQSILRDHYLYEKWNIIADKGYTSHKLPIEIMMFVIDEYMDNTKSFTFNMKIKLSNYSLYKKYGYHILIFWEPINKYKIINGWSK